MNFYYLQLFHLNVNRFTSIKLTQLYTEPNVICTRNDPSSSSPNPTKFINNFNFSKTPIKYEARKCYLSRGLSFRKQDDPTTVPRVAHYFIELRRFLKRRNSKTTCYCQNKIFPEASGDRVVSSRPVNKSPKERGTAETIPPPSSFHFCPGN